MQAMAEAAPLLEETDLATRAAWFYHAGGMTQSQVADRLGVTSVKAHRLIARATRAGLVHVFVQGPIGDCIAAEVALSQQYGLRTCHVVPPLDDEHLPLRALGIAAAGFLRAELEARRHAVIGVGHGRTLSAAVSCLPRMATEGVRLVSLLGGLPRRIAANPFEVIDRLAEKTGAEAYMVPVPMFARRAADRATLHAQHGVAEAWALAASASLVLLGIGEVSADAFLAVAGVITEAEMQDARDAGAMGEVLGEFYDRHGRPVRTALHARNLSAALPLPVSGRHVVAVAGGQRKIHAIHAALQSGLLSGLITDELTARQLVAAS